MCCKIKWSSVVLDNILVWSFIIYLSLSPTLLGKQIFADVGTWLSLADWAESWRCFSGNRFLSSKQTDPSLRRTVWTNRHGLRLSWSFNVILGYLLLSVTLETFSGPYQSSVQWHVTRLGEWQGPARVISSFLLLQTVGCVVKLILGYQRTGVYPIRHKKNS